MKKGLFSVFLAITVLFHCSAIVRAGELPVLKGKVSDVNGLSVSGAMVYVYDSPQVRRTADFISPPADKNGIYRMVVPAGRYWAVARLKKSDEFGPLMPGDKHSGDAEEIEIDTAKEHVVDFTVADLKDAIQMKRDAVERPLRIMGRIIDEQGKPVTGAYAFANRNPEKAGIPDYLSSWVDDEGRYTLYVPKGTFYIGSAAEFPPAENSLIEHNKQEVYVEYDMSGFDIVQKGPKSE